MIMTDALTHGRLDILNLLNLNDLYLHDKAYEKGFLGPSGEASVSRVQKKGRLNVFNNATSVPNLSSFAIFLKLIMNSNSYVKHSN